LQLCRFHLLEIDTFITASLVTFKTENFRLLPL
jgi:hypothetical protein